MELLLLGLIGFGAFSFFMDDDDKSPTAQRGSASTGDNANPPPPQDPITDRTFELESGVANPTGTSGNDTFTGIAEGDVLGGAGDDTFNFENGYGAEVFGGAGNDTLGPAGDAFTLHGDAGNDLFAFNTDVFDGAAAYGGTGDDRFELEISDSDVEVGPILSGGNGNDSYDLTFSKGTAEREGAGKFVTITDFAIGEDSLNVTFPELTNAELVQDPQGNFTDLRLNYLAEGSGGPIDRYMTIRLEGVTGASLEDLGVNLPDDDPNVGRLYEVSSGGLSRVDGGLGDDTIRGIADGAGLFGGGGNDVFEIEDGDSTTLDGGPGDDLMTIDLARQFNIFGGAGNDVINLDATSNIEESSIIDGGDGDDRLNIDIRLNDPFAESVDTVSGGAGADTFTLNLADFSYGADFASDQMLVIKDLTTSEDDLVITIGAGAAPFYKGATLVPNAQDGSTDLVLTFERADGTGVLRQWAGIVKLLDTKDLVLADDGPIRVSVAA